MRGKRMLALLLCLWGVACLLCGCDGSSYKKANALLEKGDYQEARRIYLKLESGGGYEDSAKKLQDCDFAEANALLEEEDFDEARRLFEKLEDYEGAAEGLLRVSYGQGRRSMENGEFAEAVEAFSAAGDYEDSRALIAECAAALMKDPQPGDPVFFGSYEQDRNTEDGAEPMQWRVLARNGERVLLLSEYVLDEQLQFGSNGYWDKCELRQWLNTAFYDAAFSGAEKASIQNMRTSDLTEDGVFLLSREEAEGLLPKPEDRIAHERFFGGEQSWWLRSVDTGTIAGRCYGLVTSGGDFWDHERYASLLPHQKEEFFAVRPAVCLSLSGAPEEAPQNMSLFGYDSNVSFGNRDRGMDMNYALEDTRLGSAVSGGSGGAGACPACGGTGAIRYNYGSSDLEAWLTGHDAYTIGRCPMCGGSGRVG